MIYSCCDGGEHVRLSHIIIFNFTNNVTGRILFKIIQNTLETHNNAFDLRKRRFKMFKTWNNQVVTEANAFVSVGRVRHKAVSSPWAFMARALGRVRQPFIRLRSQVFNHLTAEDYISNLPKLDHPFHPPPQNAHNVSCSLISIRW